MATDNGLFNVQIESLPFTFTQNFTATGTRDGIAYKYTTAKWDIAVHEVTWNVNPTFIENADELRGLTSMPWHDGAGSMACEITAKARVRPNMLGLLCYMATGGNITTTASGADHSGENTIDTDAFQHQFYWRGEDGNETLTNSLNTNLDEPVTATIKFAPTKGNGWKASGCGLSTLAFSFEDSGALVADMVFRGLYFVNDDNLNLTPAYETLTPLKRTNFKFGEGNMSPAGSKVVDVNWAIENNVANFFSFGVNSEWPDAIEYEDLWARVGGSVTKRQVLYADYQKWIGSGVNTHFAECIQGFGADLFTGSSETGTDKDTKFGFYVCMPAVQYMAMNPEAITNKRRIGVSFDWEARTDGADADGTAGTGRFCDLYVVNKQNSTAFTIGFT